MNNNKTLDEHIKELEKTIEEIQNAQIDLPEEFLIKNMLIAEERNNYDR